MTATSEATNAQGFNWGEADEDHLPLVKGQLGTAVTLNWKIGDKSYTFVVSNVDRRLGKFVQRALDMLHAQELLTLRSKIDQEIATEQKELADHRMHLFDVHKQIILFAQTESKNADFKHAVGDYWLQDLGQEWRRTLDFIKEAKSKLQNASTPQKVEDWSNYLKWAMEDRSKMLNNFLHAVRLAQS